MKITRAEKIWIVVTAFCVILYNIPGIPSLGDVKGFFLHFLITIPLLWFTGYVGMHRINRLYEIRKEEEEDDS